MASGKLCICIVMHVLKETYTYGECFCTFFYRYFTQGFPIVMFTHLIPFAFGVYKASPRQQNLAWLILWTIVVYRFGVTDFWQVVLRGDDKGEMYHSISARPQNCGNPTLQSERAPEKQPI